MIIQPGEHYELKPTLFIAKHESITQFYDTMIPLNSEAHFLTSDAIF